MPGLVVPTRRSLSAAEDDDTSDTARESTDAYSSSTTAPNKRARLSNDRERRTTSDSWHLDTPKTATQPARTARSSTSATVEGSQAVVYDGQASPAQRPHQPGSLVRITVTNFVTYSAASFYPGPALNMVIGPNGTGKSTLVCAICLGLGWGTQHLGRAKDVREFVKHGSDEAFIEIELQGEIGKTNPIVKRQIKKDNSTKWWLNGRVTTRGAITEMAKSFNIQIDNLCQFLPQDRVVEFAALNPIDRLTQTVQATAPDYMVEYHEKLKAFRAEQKQMEKDHSNAKETLTNLEARQNLQQADVDRFREREKLLGEIEVLEAFRPAAEMNVADIELHRAKERKAAARQELSRLETEIAPNLEALNQKKEYAKKVSDVLNRRKELYTNLERQTEEANKKMEALAEKMKSCDQKTQAERQADKTRAKKAEELQRRMQQIKVAMENAPPHFDPAEYNEKSRDVTRRLREIQDRIRELEEEAQRLQVEFSQKQKRKDDATKEVENLRSRAGQQMSVLKRESPDTYAAWEWIQQHQSEFEGQIYGPPLVVCSVNNEKFVDRIETLFQRSELCIITTTNERDRDKLSNQLIKTMNLSDVTLRCHRQPLTSYPPPVEDGEKKRLGISGWALDYVSGPDTVLAMLCSERCRLNRTAIYENDITEHQFQDLQQSVIENWVTKTSSYRITRRREYNASSTAISQIKAAKYWTQQQVDTRHEGDLRDNIDGWTSELEELKQQRLQINQKRKQLRDQEVELVDEGKTIDAEKADLQTKTSKFNALPNKLKEVETQLASEKGERTKLQTSLDEIAAEKSALTIQKGQAAINLSNLVEQLRKFHVQVVEAAVANLEATCDVTHLEDRNKHVTEALEAKKQELIDIRDDERAKMAECKRLRQEIKERKQRDPAIWERIAELPAEETERTPEELTMAIENLNSRLGLLHGGNAGMIREFEERAKKIERLKSTLSEMDGKLSEMSLKIDEVRSKWEPELDVLVEQISEAFGASFAKINCAGEVRIHKEGEGGRDFDNWAIIIKVKFREEEDLSALDSHRQSGGERAVSTIFYLMALQSLSRAPFRVVDEINQGMDPRNERMVHERMVDIACGGALEAENEGDEDADAAAHVQSSQYFLITPKLLPGLKYSPGMKVHCIVSGDFIPSDPETLDLKKLVQSVKRSRAGRASVLPRR